VKQLKVSFPTELRDQLEKAAEVSGSSLGEEVRHRLEQSFLPEQLDNPTRRLIGMIGQLAGLVRLQTGKEWSAHPTAHRFMVSALNAYLQRVKPEGEELQPKDLPARQIIASTDAEKVGLLLEAFAFTMPRMTEGDIAEVYGEAHEKQQKGRQR
jgi:Arc-like DNA binding domain